MDKDTFSIGMNVEPLFAILPHASISTAMNGAEFVIIPPPDYSSAGEASVHVALALLA